MKPTIAILSYHRLTSLINSMAERYSQTVNLVVIDTLLETVLAETLKMEQNKEADVFVSAGATARLLSRHLQSPFLEIQVTGFDILLALKKAREYSEKIAVITYQNKFPCLEEVATMLPFPVREVTFTKMEDLDRTLDDLHKEGIQTVVGSSLIIERAQLRGMSSVFIYSRESITLTLDAAVKVALSKKIESEKAERFRLIIDFAYNGIIATDQRGNITVFNPAAEKIMGIPKEKVLGQPAQDTIPNTKLNRILKNGKPEYNQLQAIGEISILTNRLPIIINGETMGAIATFQDIGSIQKAEETIRQRLNEKGFLAKSHFQTIFGNSDSLQKVKREASLYAKTDSIILIMGESGTGKELFAQGIHNASLRAKHPFVAVNCAALPENLLESELFGYEEGAFTGARKGGKPGLFELAHGGTLFLDEIGEISQRLQSRLLRVLEEREVMRIGADKIISVNIRIIAATNKKLWELVERGEFREDLYYRLNVFELHLPPLRERGEDAVKLGIYFLSNLRPNLTEKEKTHIFSHPLFRSYHWPGNIRELKNVIERIAVLYNQDSSLDELFASVLHNNNVLKPINPEKKEILKVLNEARGNKAEAARRLGISRTSLWRKLQS
ncbi:MAG: sigma 54-interacting transcriptional regulator [Clostridia bacterium]|jgi:propionate catabolism operon transcriptional regulator|nr:sigma 54-interacting transcriptional regulator [Clostridia bacterium]